MIIITKVEHNRVIKFLPVSLEEANKKLEELLVNFPDAFIYDGEYSNSLWVENKQVTIVPIVESVGIPLTVSMRQARLALLQSGLLEVVNQAIANGNEADKITWEYATEVQRSDSLVKNLASKLGLSEKDLDNLFLLASTL